MNLILIALVVDFGLQIVFGGISILIKTEKFYDFIGAITHISCAFLGVFYEYEATKEYSFLYRLIQAVCVAVWAAKLGAFLLYRVIKAGGDSRFEAAKKSPVRLFVYWMLQGVWVFLNILPSLFMWISTKAEPEHWYICVVSFEHKKIF